MLSEREEELVTVEIEPEEEESGAVHIRQVIPRDGADRIVGGMTYRFEADP